MPHNYHEADVLLYFSKKQIFHDKAQLNLSNFNKLLYLRLIITHNYIFIR